MFTRRFFPADYYAPRYYPVGEGGTVEPPPIGPGPGPTDASLVWIDSTVLARFVHATIAESGTGAEIVFLGAPRTSGAAMHVGIVAMDVFRPLGIQPVGDFDTANWTATVALSTFDDQTEASVYAITAQASLIERAFGRRGYAEASTTHTIAVARADTRYSFVNAESGINAGAVITVSGRIARSSGSSLEDHPS